jgi:hypothetical protein
MRTSEFMSKPIKMPIRKPQTSADLPATPVLPTRKKPQTCNSPTRTKPRRKIDAAIIAQMAQAVATMLTESEAARLCGLEPRHWFEWKSRAGREGKFSALLEEFRANKIAGLLERVQKSADGVDVKFPDFRAALALLKFQDQKRFGDSPAVVMNPTPMIQISIIHEQLKKVIGFDLPAKALPPAPVGETLPK